VTADDRRARIDGYRRRIGDEIARGRAAFQAALDPAAPPTFPWCGAELWVDRARWIAFPAHEVARAGAIDVDTLPADTRRGERLLAMYGGARRDEASHRVLRTLTEIAVGARFHAHGPSLVHLVNALAIQPLVNPAFEPLYWLVLASDADALAPSGDLYRVLDPMMFDMSQWPASRADAPAVRQAQIRVVSELAAVDVAGAAEASDEGWAATCAEALASRHALVEGRVWADIESRAASVTDHA
jgi:hypothetical protein